MSKVIVIEEDDGKAEAAKLAAAKARLASDVAAAEARKAAQAAAEASRPEVVVIK